MNTPHLALGKSLNRRHFLRGAGSAMLGLPFLEAMLPAFSRAAGTTSPNRFVAMCATLGFHGPHLFPTKEGQDYEATPYLAKLKDHRSRLTVFSGLSHPEQQGNNGHASEMTWLTSARRPGLAGFKNSVSLDQVIAASIGNRTRYPFLALSTSGRSMSWTANGVEIPGETSPAKLFKTLFIQGTGQEVAAEMKNFQRGRSILDTVLGEAKSLERELGARDREKLDEYLASVRELEVRLQQSEGWVQKPKPRVEAAPPKDVQDRNDAIARQRLMNDMIVLALQTDSTRTVTFQLSGMNAVPTIPGVKNDWHNLSHHGKDPAKIDELKIIEEAEFGVFSEFLTKLQSIGENGATLLDRTAVLYGSNLGNASSHDWRNLPILVAGGGFRHQGYVAHDGKDNTPLANLFVPIAQRMGVEIERFGSSTSAGVRGLEG
jgi:BMFP domain-containing protein YqiC